MRRRGSIFALAASIALAAPVALSEAGCGGHVATTGDGGAAGDGGADGATMMDAAPQPDGPAPVDCAALKAEVDGLRTEARTCCPFCNMQQCAVAVADVCCPISITAPSAPAFSAAVAKYKAQCPQACPASPCPRAPSDICKPIDPMNPSSRGLCQ